jgi:uncharacterized protein (TIGR03089 family)
VADVTTFPALLSRLLRGEPGRPLLTYYDHASGERTELSVTTYANWVAKAASLLVEEHDLARGDRLRIDLPTHWLGPVFLGAAWTAGLTVTDADDPDAVVCGPGSLAAWAPRAGEIPVLACSLLPLGVRFAEPLPDGVHDVGVDIWSQPDSFAPWDPPQPGDPATAYAGEVTTQEQLWSAAAAGSLLTDGGRLLSEANPASPPGLATFTEPLARSGSLVLVSHAERHHLEATYAAERATARFPA